MSDLSDEEFKNLFIRYQHGDREASVILVGVNQGLVVHIADRHATRLYSGQYEGGLSSEISWEDLRQAGNLGLMEAMRDFDVAKASVYGKGVRRCFDVYSGYWIEKEIRLFIISCLVIKNARGKFREISILYPGFRKSIDKLDHNEGSEGMGVFPAPKPKENFTELVRKMIDCLTPEQKEAIALRYGLDNNEGRSSAQIAVYLNKDEDCIKSRLVQALKKLRFIYENYERTGKIKPY